ncbi:MAG: VWA domain-containing protein [Deltaproteobacteria bacterium]|nr:VWA domain-containing protein [Deltaproteobacteria bacterium]
MLRFASPWLLALLAFVPLLSALAVFDARRRSLRLAKLIDLGLVPAVVVGASSGRRTLRAAVVVVATLLLGIAVATPLTEGEPRLLPRQGLDVLFVVDVSRSMRARDVQPDRLERAKAEIGAALDRIAEHRVGVVAFAGTAFLQCPLTTDVEAVRLFLRALTPDAVPQGGSDLGASLEVARNALMAEDSDTATPTARKKVGRVVVVVSDGEDHEMLEGAAAGEGLDELGKQLQDLGATVVVLGVGSTLGEPIPVVNAQGDITGYLKDRSGQTVVTRMNPDILQAAAQAVGGVFVDGTTRPDLGLAEVEAKINGLEKRELEARTQRDDVDRSLPFALAALLLMLVWLALPERSS